LKGIDGSSTIKVFGQIEYFEKQFKSALDENTSAMMNFMAAQRWLGVRFQVLGSFAVLFASVFVVSYNNKLKIETGLIAMLIIWASHFTITLGFFSQAVSESEAYLTSVERARDMAELPQESSFETVESNKPKPDWPVQGTLSFEEVCLRYRPGLPLALKGLTFTAEPGQRVGICGRTGAGKVRS
jgi:ABC-type bacteriocin/lantibiotic exporters, contain an N-terminal double-glycine peptidase domain